MATATDKKKIAADYKDDIIKMRLAGKTYAEIGDELGYSHEHIRQQIRGVKFPGLERTARQMSVSEREKRIAEMNTWLEANGPVTRDEFMEEFDMTPAQVHSSRRYGLRTEMLLSATGDMSLVYEKDSWEDAVRRAWEVEQGLDPGARGLSGLRYEALRDTSRDPSHVLIVSRLGWSDMCRRAGVPDAGTPRPKDTYHSAWTDDDILDAVKVYVEERLEEGKRPSYLGYDKWQRQDAKYPSGATVRNRMRQNGLGVWAEVVKVSLNR